MKTQTFILWSLMLMVILFTITNNLEIRSLNERIKETETLIISEPSDYEEHKLSNETSIILLQVQIEEINKDIYQIRQNLDMMRK